MRDDLMDGIQLRIYLLKHGDDETQARAAAELEDHGAAAVRALCAEVKALSGKVVEPPEVSEALLPLLQDMVDRNPVARVRAAYGFSQSSSERALEGLLCLSRDADPEVRRAATHGLGTRQDPRAIRFLRALVGDPDYRVPVLAVEALAQFGPPGASMLADIVRNASYDRARKAAMKALARMDSPFRLVALSEGLNDVDPEVRRSAALAIGQAQLAEGAPELIKLLSDMQRVAEAAIEALLAIGDPAIPNLCTALDSHHGPTWTNALHTVHEMARRRPTQAMLPVWNRLRPMRWRLRGEMRRVCMETLDLLEEALPGAGLPVPSKDPNAHLPIPSSERITSPSPDLPRPVDGA